MNFRKLITKDIISFSEDKTQEHAIIFMKDYTIGSLPMNTDEKVIGVRDMDIVYEHVSDDKDIETKRILETMIPRPIVSHNYSNVDVIMMYVEDFLEGLKKQWLLYMAIQKFLYRNIKDVINDLLEIMYTHN